MDLKRIRPGSVQAQGAYACNYTLDLKGRPEYHVWRKIKGIHKSRSFRLPIDWSELPMKHRCRLLLPECPRSADELPNPYNYPCRSKAKLNKTRVLPTTFTQEEWYDHLDQLQSRRDIAPYRRKDRKTIVLAANLERMYHPLSINSRPRLVRFRST